MIVSDIINLIQGELHTCEDEVGIDIKSACGADLMSDVMAFSKENALLLTGLVNPQVIRTAEMLDIQVVIFVRGKRPTEVMCELAEEKRIVLASSDLTMFTCCGLLYEAGIVGTGN
ncbi:MAG TPA: hypothetical protein VFD00_02395 [Thermoclostridium sp.]|nr:hypothetical protein [Thermoclostridium sp.]